MSVNKKSPLPTTLIFPVGSCLDFGIAISASYPNGGLDKSKAIVAVSAGISLAAITSCKGDIDHFPHRDEVQAVFGSVGQPFHQFPKEILDWLPQHR